MGVYWNSAHQERLLALVSLTHLHWLPGQNQFYPATRLQLRLGNCSTIGFPNFHHLYLRPEALLYFLPQLSTQKQRGQSLYVSISQSPSLVIAARGYFHYFHQTSTHKQCGQSLCVSISQISSLVFATRINFVFSCLKHSHILIFIVCISGLVLRIE